MKKRYFTGYGLLAGSLYDGGLGAYETPAYSSDTLEDLKEQIQRAFESGDIDKAGFSMLLATKIDIIEEATIEVDGREFTSKQFVETFEIGEKQYLDFLDKIIETQGA